MWKFYTNLFTILVHNPKKYIRNRILLELNQLKPSQTTQENTAGDSQDDTLLLAQVPRVTHAYRWVWVRSHKQAGKHFSRSPENTSSAFPSQLTDFWQDEFPSIGSRWRQPITLRTLAEGWLGHQDKPSLTSFLSFTHSTSSHTLLSLGDDSDFSLLPKPRTLRAFVFFWPQMNPTPLKNRLLIPHTRNFPWAKISQVGWVWGQQPPEGTPTRQPSPPKVKHS